MKLPLKTYFICSSCIKKALIFVKQTPKENKLMSNVFPSSKVFKSFAVDLQIWKFSLAGCLESRVTINCKLWVEIESAFWGWNKSISQKLPKHVNPLNVPSHPKTYRGKLKTLGRNDWFTCPLVLNPLIVLRHDKQSKLRNFFPVHDLKAGTSVNSSTVHPYTDLRTKYILLLTACAFIRQPSHHIASPLVQESVITFSTNH